ncbi:unnamed protein product [Absidia cylindrospora]
MSEFDFDIITTERLGTRCSDCKRERPASCFIGKTRPFKTCDECRFKDTPPVEAPPFEDMILLSELAEFFIPSERHSEVNIFMDDYLSQLSMEQLVEEIVEAVERCDQFRYYVIRIGNPMLRFITNFAATCCQRDDVQKQEHDDNERRRVRQRMETYDCGGSIVGNIDPRQLWINLKIDHQNHPSPIQSNDTRVSDEVKNYIRHHALTTTSPELYRRVCQQFGLGTTRA